MKKIDNEYVKNQFKSWIKNYSDFTKEEGLWKNIQNVLIYLLLFITPFFTYAFKSNKITYIAPSIAYQNNYNSRDISFNFNMNFKHHNLYLGLNTIINDDYYILANREGNIFYHTAYPNGSFIQRFTYNIGYEYVFLIKKHPNFEPFIFLNENIGYNRIRSIHVFPEGQDANGFDLYSQIPVIFKPSLTLEHIIGFGVHIKTINNFFINLSIGASYTMRFLDQKSGISVDGTKKFELMYYQILKRGFSGGLTIDKTPYFNIGLSYRFYSKEKTKKE